MPVADYLLIRFHKLKRGPSGAGTNFSNASLLSFQREDLPPPLLCLLPAVGPGHLDRGRGPVPAGGRALPPEGVDSRTWLHPTGNRQVWSNDWRGCSYPALSQASVSSLSSTLAAVADLITTSY